MSDSTSRLKAAHEGRYRMERKLGEGGMAMVHLADDLRHERKVALKEPEFGRINVVLGLVRGAAGAGAQQLRTAH